MLNPIPNFLQGSAISRDVASVIPVTPDQIEMLGAGVEWARNLELPRKMKHFVLASVLLIGTLLSGCAAQPMKQAKVDSYMYRAVVQDVLEGECRLGNSRTTFSEKYAHLYKKEYTKGGDGIWVTDLKSRPMIVRCTWLAADGSPREESANLSELLLPPYFKWDFEDVEVHREDPIQFSPDVHVVLRDKVFQIVTKAKIRYLGERLPDGSVRLPNREVSHVLYERTGQESK